MTIEKTISNLVEGQFPSFYHEEGPIFVEFVKAYYEWLEGANGVAREARSLLEYHDIDTTVDDFLIHFKGKYLNNLQFETAVASRDMVKHSLDLYRSKGTERSIDLFFKSVFAVPATIYYPGTDMFKTSAATWAEPIYLEVDPTDNIYDFIGVQIEGVTSGATAFVDRYSKKKAKDSTYITHVLYLQNVVSDFITGEKIRISKSGVIGPTIIGSLNILTVTDGAGGYSLGDLVYLNSTYSGKNGKARVTGIQSISGRADFTLIDGGWGYNSDSEVIVSEKSLTVANLQASNANFIQFETVIQEMAILQYNALTGPEFETGDIIYRASDVGNTLYAAALVVDANTSNSTAGTVKVNFLQGTFGLSMTATLEDGDDLTFENGVTVDLDGVTGGGTNFIYTIEDQDFANVIATSGTILTETVVSSANIISMVDSSASANVMQVASNTTISVDTPNGMFVVGEQLYQLNANTQEIVNGSIVAVSYNGSNGLIQVVDVVGDWALDTVILSKNSSSSAVITELGERIGVFEVDEDFANTSGNVIRGLDSGATGTLTNISLGFGAYFELVNTFTNEEEVTINTDIIGDYVTVGLSDPDYGFPSPGVTNVYSNILDALTYDTDFYGTISGIITKSQGENYNGPPFVVVYEPRIARLNKRNYYVNISDATGQYAIGEVVEVGGHQRGIVLEANSTQLYLQRISYLDPILDDFLGTEVDEEFLTFENDDPMTSEQDNADIVGVASGSRAEVGSWETEPLSKKIGLNALVFANTTTSNGNVTTLKVVDSGFNYFTGETVTFYANSASLVGQAEVTEMKQGRALGYYKTNDSVLSGNKYLQDSDYYQTFSYEIRSGISLDRYADMLKNILHPAGTKAFSRFVNETELDVAVGIETSITVE